MKIEIRREQVDQILLRGDTEAKQVAVAIGKLIGRRVAEQMRAQGAHEDAD